MIHGRYATLPGSRPPAPYVRASVSLPHLSVWKSIDFLVDTGADRTCLNPRDVLRLELEPGTLDPDSRRTHAGIGGGLDYYIVAATLVFRAQPNIAVWRWRIGICDIWSQPLDRRVRRLPSLLGRDFLNLCDVHANASQNSLVLGGVVKIILSTLPLLESGRLPGMRFHSWRTW